MFRDSSKVDRERKITGFFVIKLSLRVTHLFCFTVVRGIFVLPFKPKISLHNTQQPINNTNQKSTYNFLSIFQLLLIFTFILKIIPMFLIIATSVDEGVPSTLPISDTKGQGLMPTIACSLPLFLFYIIILLKFLLLKCLPFIFIPYHI